jgi:hypothetical protein
MNREIELEPMTGYYRLIEHDRSGAQERARYNLPAGDVALLTQVNVMRIPQQKNSRETPRKRIA